VYQTTFIPALLLLIAPQPIYTLDGASTKGPVTSYSDHKIDIGSNEAAENKEGVLGGSRGRLLDKANLHSQPNLASASLTMYPRRWLRVDGNTLLAGRPEVAGNTYRQLFAAA